jgi:hypothetical protein
VQRKADQRKPRRYSLTSVQPPVDFCQFVPILRMNKGCGLNWDEDSYFSLLHSTNVSKDMLIEVHTGPKI